MHQVEHKEITKKTWW